MVLIQFIFYRQKRRDPLDFQQVVLMVTSHRECSYCLGMLRRIFAFFMFSSTVETEGKETHKFRQIYIHLVSIKYRGESQYWVLYPETSNKVGEFCRHAFRPTGLSTQINTGRCATSETSIPSWSKGGLL